jgi:hypothetical protein
VSWPLASFAIVFGVLAVGWLAYERSRPSARMAAVVGTLAAIAALGRDAFVALPDVKPITAMTFVVGYALGPLPGFSVGAVGMLASNVLLGQGPYTPWQMAAWGLVGLLGAALGRLTGGLGRVRLALGCACSALIAKEIMNVYEWTVSASHTLPSLALIVGKGVPFDVTDVVASFLFGLAFGPELTRLLARTRERMTVVWEPSALAAALLALTALALPGGLARPVGASAQPSRGLPRLRGLLRAAATPVPAHPSQHVATVASSEVVPRVVAFLERAQDADGGFGGAPGERSSELYSAWAALGLAAAGRDPTDVQRSGHSVLDAIRNEAATLGGAGDLERTILALRACGAPASLPGLGDLLVRLERYREDDGSFEHLVNITAFAVLALAHDGRTAGDPVVSSAVAWLDGQQDADGGFGYSGRGGVADVDDTGAVVQALAAAGQADGSVASAAIRFLERSVSRDGGFPQQPGGEPNAQSTAWAVQGLVAAHRDPARPLPGARRSPLAYLQALTAPNGSVRYSLASTQTPVWVAAQALTALARKPLPIGAPTSGGSSALSGSHGAGSSSSSRSQLRPSASVPALGSSSGSQLQGSGPSSKGRAGGAADRVVIEPDHLQAELDALARVSGMTIAILLAPIESS